MVLSIVLGCLIVVLIVVASSERAEAIAELNDDPAHAHWFKNNKKG
ncbi:hypothetical protein [Paenibacillus xylaniclasticus]|nr:MULTISPECIES: hypothetical protein [Paenibacillus]GFN31546.1 hypothetical protein PCURB6_18060 [Paenibacillus curdlanolyticus]